MNIRQYTLITLFTLTALGLASCDIAPVAPELADTTEVPVLTSRDASDPQVGLDGETPHQFKFDMVLMDEGAYRRRDRIIALADRWARIVEGSDLEDIEWEPGTIRCGGLEYDFQQNVLDDVFIMISVRDYFTGSNTGAALRICGYRESSKLPLVGALFLDIDGVSEGQVNDLILHSFGHMLGFGVSWEDLDLLRNSAWWDEGADTHFAGPRAAEAFVVAGGANFTGSRVPVENDWFEGDVDIHWRKSVFGTEVMTAWLNERVADPISAITIQSLADIGYTVDMELADAYTLPDPRASAMEAGTAIPVTEEVMITPAVFYDRQGRVVRVVPPN